MKRLAILSLLLATTVLLVNVSFAQDETPEATESVVSAYVFPADVATRDLEIDLGNDWVTHAQLTYPAVGAGPFPVVILFHGTGSYDLDATYIENVGEPPVSANFRLIAERFAQQGIAVLRYNKRGVRASGDYDAEQIEASTVDQLVADARVVLTAALEQPEVDGEQVYLYGWSAGSSIVANLATFTSDTIAGLILQGTPQGDFSQVLRYQYIDLGLPYLTDTIDADNDGELSLAEIATIEPGPIMLMKDFFLYDRTSTPELAVINSFVDADSNDLIDIEAELRPAVEQFIMVRLMQSRNSGKA